MIWCAEENKLVLMTFMVHDVRSQAALDIKVEVAFVTMVDEAIAMASKRSAKKMLINIRWLCEENEGVLM
jgi:hypothetical protein